MKPTIPNIRLPTLRLTASAILYAVAIANAFRLGWAYAFVDAGGNILSVPGLAGALLGAALSLGTAFVAGKVPSVKGKVRTLMTWIGLGTILALEPVILAPISVTDMPASLKATLPGGWPWLWGITAALLPSLVLASVSFANGTLVESVASSQPEPAKKPEKPADSQPEPVNAAPQPAYFCKVTGCSGNSKTSDGSYPTQAALNAHQAKHKPAVVNQQPAAAN